MTLRVLFWLPSAKEIPGGHRVQAEETARALQSHGMDVTVSRDADPRLGRFSLVHGFGLSPARVRRCRDRGVPVCLSTLYCSRRWTLGLDQRQGGGRQLARRTRLALVLGLGGMRLTHIDKYEEMMRRPTDQRLAFESADLLLPNSALEANTLRRELRVTTPMAVVPNGIDHTVFGQPAVVEDNRDDIVLYVGRFEPHKNQLGLIRALRGRPYKLILVGPVHPHHLDYLERCRHEAGDVEFIQETTQQELVSLYRKARVHALPSWYETTGLVSLEAATMGCNIVSTNRGYARDYLGSNAWYCDPARDHSIAAAVDAAMQADFDPALRARILERFTWQNAADATIQAYKGVLATRLPGTGTA